MRKKTKKSFLGETFSRCATSAETLWEKCIWSVKEQERDRCVWKGMSKVVCDTRRQSGELQVGNSRRHRSRSFGHCREEPSITDTLSDVESYRRVLSRGVARSNLQLTRISVANNRQKCPPVITPKYTVYSSYNIASLSPLLKQSSTSDKEIYIPVTSHILEENSPIPSHTPSNLDSLFLFVLHLFIHATPSTWKSSL